MIQQSTRSLVVSANGVNTIPCVFRDRCRQSFRTSQRVSTNARFVCKFCSRRYVVLRNAKRLNEIK